MAAANPPSTSPSPRLASVPSKARHLVAVLRNKSLASLTLASALARDVLSRSILLWMARLASCNALAWAPKSS